MKSPSVKRDAAERRAGRIILARGGWIDTSRPLAVAPQHWRVVSRFDTADGALERAGISLVRLASGGSAAYLAFAGKKRCRILWSEDPPTDPSPLALLESLHEQIDLRGRIPLEIVAGEQEIAVWRAGTEIAALALPSGTGATVPALIATGGAAAFAAEVAPAPSLCSRIAASSPLPPPIPRPTFSWDSPASNSLSLSIAAELEAMLAELSLFQRGDGPEAIHQARVAARRLLLLLGMAGVEAAEAGTLKRYHRELGEIRNLDITLDWLERTGAAKGSAWQVASRREKAVAQIPLAEMTASLRGYAFEPKPELSGLAYGEVIDRQRRKAIRELATMEIKRDFASLHAMRRRLRRYRYLLQFQPAAGPEPYLPSGMIQALGQIADYTVIKEILGPEQPEIPQIDRALARLLPAAHGRAIKVQRRLRQVAKAPRGRASLA